MKLNATKATIVYVNNRKEKHGEKQMLAVDVKVQIKGPPELLDEYDPTLRPDFFSKEEGKDHVPKHPEITSFPWEREFKEAEFKVGEIVYPKATVNGFVFEIREGGVVTATWSAHFLIAPEQLGPLADHMKEEAIIELMTQFDLVDEAQQVERQAA